MKGCNKLFVRSLLVASFLLLTVAPVSAQKEANKEVDVKEIVFGHIMDSYEWHITEYNGKPIAIYLPVIVKGESSGWHIFFSSKFQGGHEYEGFYIATAGDYERKIVEKNAKGEVVRPLDISITKNVFSLLLNSILLVVIMLSVTRFYKRNTYKKAPGGFIGMMEVVIMTIYQDVVITCVGKDYKRYAPYLLTVFFFILINNLMGLIPFFPGGANVTGNIAITVVLAFCTFIAVNVFGSKEYWKEIFWPEVPIWMKFPVPMMPAIEFVGILTKPFALMIRLMANIMAGHAAILGLTSLVFVTVSMGPAVNSGMTVVSVLFCLFMNCIELLVAFLQAYVFTMLSAVFIGLSRIESHHKEKTIE